ncbi:unnamed protein product [Boreogadus saida]
MEKIIVRTSGGGRDGVMEDEGQRNVGLESQRNRRRGVRAIGVNSEVHNPSPYSGDILKAFKSTDAYQYAVAGWVKDAKEDMEEVFHNMAAEEDLRVNAMFLGRWVDSQ